MFFALKPAEAIADDTPAAVTEIRENYRACREMRRQKSGLVKMYGAYSDLNTQERPDWSLSIPKSGFVLSLVNLYSRPGRQIRFAQLSEATPSEDWFRVTEYCYREDGSLAFIFSNFRTSFGNVRVEDRLYFNSQGAQIRDIRRIFDLDTGKRLPDGTDSFSDRDIQKFISADVLASELGASELEPGSSGAGEPGGATPSADGKTVVASDTQTAERQTTRPPQTPPVALDATQQADILKLVAEIIPQIEAVAGENIVSGLNEILRQPASAGEYVFLANAALINNRVAMAAWFFAQSIVNGAVTPQGLNNLGVALEESLKPEPEKRPENWPAASRILLKTAIDMSPRDAMILNNLGRNAFGLGTKTNDAALLDEAISNLKKAIEIEPDRPFFLANIAEMYLERGASELAAAALALAHQLNSADPGYMSVAGKPIWQQTPAWTEKPRNYCDINYACQQTCPGGITGRVMVVSCEIEQANAIAACGAGKPYAKKYRCEEEIPEFGILIPGLNSGFSIITPFGRIDLTMNGAGKVNYRIKAGPKLPGNLRAELETRGSYSTDGGIRVQRITSKISLNIPTGTAVGKQLDQLNMGPMTVSITDQGGGTVKIESFDATLWAY